MAIKSSLRILSSSSSSAWGSITGILSDQLDLQAALDAKLSTIVGIAAGGELSGTYPNPAVLNSAILSKVLTGLNITGSNIVAADNILQAFGKIQNQLNGVLGGAIYQSTWNASTNSPTLIDGTGTKGHYYVASVAGSQNLGSGSIDFNVGDWVIYNGTIWQKVDNTDAVTSVNGFIGTVNLTTANVSEVSNLYWTTTRFNTAFSGKTTTDLTEGSNLYFTNARAIASLLTGYSSGAGVVSSADSILSAIQKLDGNIAAVLTSQNVGNLINSSTNKTTPVNADYIGLMDSAASNILKKLSWANIKATLLTYFSQIFVIGGCIHLANDTVYNSTSLANTLLTFPAAANKAYVVEIWGQVNKTTASGVRIGVNGPSGATVTGTEYRGAASYSTAYTNGQVSALNTETGTFAAVATTDISFSMRFTIFISATAGNVYFMIKSVTSGDITLKKGSYLKWKESVGV